MYGSKCRPFIFLFLFLAMQVYADEDFFVAPIGEAVGFGWDGMAYGGGLAVGYGDGAAIGIRFMYAQDTQKFVFMELQCFLRLYFFNMNASTGPFIQVSGGPVIFSDSTPEISGYGNISAGLSAGWRFPLGKHWYIEPVVRTGYPYIFGGGISTGFRKGANK